MLNRRPLPEAEQPLQRTASWAIPGPSIPATQPVLKLVMPPLIQLAVTEVATKIEWTREMLVGFRAP